jgi:asparagine synthase (glutamine-hydrolysing)
MCGISAIVDPSGRPGLVEELLAMHASIPHRGPDGEGFCVVAGDGRVVDASSAEELRARAGNAPRAGFAFRWLQIQDRDPASAQPMASEDGAVRLLFNGEIYNFRELRKELASLGRAFRTRSDTEVVLAAYERWGDGMFARLEGMWAIVVLDSRTRSVIVSRDRFGIKPLFLHRDGARLRFASEVKQLLSAGVPAVANRAAVAGFIRGRRPQPPESTFFDAISAQPPATFARIALEDERPPAFVSYWTLPEAPPASGALALDAATDRLDALLAASVSDHLVAAVPVGILVSGGLDSSLVAAMSAPHFAARGERADGYSMIPQDAARHLDEGAYIDRVIQAYGLTGHTTRLAPAGLKERIAAITRVQEEPVAGFAAAAQFAVFELAAHHGSRVVLDGQGADELFAGYPRHQVAYLGELARSKAITGASLGAASMVLRDRGFARDLWRGALAPRARRMMGARDVPIDFLRSPHDVAPRGEGATTLDATLRADVLRGNLRAVLALTDRNSMAHSIEARVPYVHRPLVEFAFSLPAALKVGAGLRKRVLRAVGARYLPREIAARRDRIGFGAPGPQWLAADFAPELRALADSPTYRDAATVDRETLRAYVDALLAGRHRDAGAIWRLYAVDQWAREYAVAGI